MTKKDFVKNNTCFVIDINKALRIKLTESFKKNLILCGYTSILIMDCKTGVQINYEKLTTK